ncbi:MAG TPA: DinB family protein [Candidatus Solibacter sp.]|nr:DinB family protein [Candidatus Solibacter sp.]
MPRILSALCLMLVIASTVRLSAQVYPYRDGTPGVTGYRSEVMAEVMIQESEFVRLAEAIPADKYTWRPSSDVRTIAEVFLHASAANYNLYKLVGTPTPADVNTKTLEQSTTDKAKVISVLKASYAHAKKAILAMPDADLEKTLDWNGGTITERGVLLYIVQHIAQHLGQQIAYARSVGVAPPWTTDPPRVDPPKKN